jgi:hypothetical protein
MRTTTTDVRIILRRARDIVGARHEGDLSGREILRGANDLEMQIDSYERLLWERQHDSDDPEEWREVVDKALEIEKRAADYQRAADAGKCPCCGQCMPERK